MNKKGFQFSFAWLFGIIVGAAVIFLAIYATVRAVDIGTFETGTKTAAQLGILLHPVETNLEEGRYALIEFPEETRMFNSCRITGNFGRQGISTSVKSGFGNEWPRQGVETVFYNKYIFSDVFEQGSELHVFVKPLEMPYKIGDLIFVSSKDYCFVQPSREIEEEIEDLGLGHVNVTERVEDCKFGSVTVCFSDSGCDIDVSLQTRGVEKNGKILHYVGPLVYGAIFSDPDIYECQVKRLMKRSGELAHVFIGKTEYLSTQGCSGNLAADLTNFALLSDIESSQELNQIETAADQIRRRNDLLACRIF